MGNCFGSWFRNELVGDFGSNLGGDFGSNLGVSPVGYLGGWFGGWDF